MKKFSELHNEQINNYIGANRRLHEAARSFTEATEEIKNKIDQIFSDSIINQSTRSEIISKLSPVFEYYNANISDDYKEKITADWLYYEGLRILSPQIIEENGKKFIVGRRRGSNGGFVITEILEDAFEVNEVKEKVS